MFNFSWDNFWSKNPKAFITLSFPFIINFVFFNKASLSLSDKISFFSFGIVSLSISVILYNLYLHMPASPYQKDFFKLAVLSKLWILNLDLIFFVVRKCSVTISLILLKRRLDWCYFCKKTYSIIILLCYCR